MPLFNIEATTYKEFIDQIDNYGIQQRSNTKLKVGVVRLDIRGLSEDEKRSIEKILNIVMPQDIIIIANRPDSALCISYPNAKPRVML